MNNKILLVLLLLIICNIFCSDDLTIVKYPVLVNQDTLFTYQTWFGSFSPLERAKSTTEKIENLLKTKTLSDSIYIVNSEFYTEIFVGNISIMTLIEDDILFENTTIDSLVVSIVDRLTDQLKISDFSSNYFLIVKTFIWSSIILLITFSLIFIIVKFNHKFETILENINQRETIIISFIPKINFKKPLSVCLYFYDGIKLILIIFIIIECMTFLLKIAKLNQVWNYQPLFSSLFSAIILTIISYYIYKLLKLGAIKILLKFNLYKPKILKKMQYKSFSILSEDKLIEFAIILIRILYFGSIVVLLYAYTTLLFSLFSFTKTWAEKLFGYILTPLLNTLKGIVGYLPNVFAIIIIFYIFKFALKLIKTFFDAIQNGSIKLNGFYQDWAKPTYLIIRFLVIIFGLVVVFPYLPGSDSPFFKGISVFLGVLISFGSSSAIANIIAGIVITYMRPFKEGDFIRIADTRGRVIEKTLLVTRIRTIKNLDITIPNSLVLSSHITNFSSIADEKSIILHSEVTMGYDTPWQKVENALIKAALMTDYVLNDPKPFVFHKALDNKYVTYEINIHTHESQIMSKIYSDLHKNIQNVFNEEGLEMVTITYTAIRDGNKKVIPEDYLDKDYEKPGFKLDPITNLIVNKK